jgi:hypothetical protein
MTWGKIATTAATVLLLTGCSAPAPQASSPTAEPSPSATSGLAIVNITGDRESDWFIAVLKASCQRGKDAGLAVYVPQEQETIYTFPQQDDWSYSAYWNMMTTTGAGSDIGGWFDGDVICNESRYLEGNLGGDLNLRKINDTTFEWTAGRPSAAEISTATFTIKNDLVQVIEEDGSMDFTFQLSYGPFSQEKLDTYNDTLVASGDQYMYLTKPMWGMTLEGVKSYAKTHGLTVVVGVQDSEYFEIKGPSDPKRMIVSLGEGRVVVVWTE